MNKKTRKAFSKWIALGWYIKRNGNHLIWAHPQCKQCVTTAATPSDHRAMKNADRYFKKAMLEAGLES